MSISLEKRAEKVKISLVKKGVNVAPTLRVGCAFDESGSMEKYFKIPRNGDSVLQETFNRIMGVAITFDDNGELDCFGFTDKCRSIGTATPANYTTYVKDHLKCGGGTAYYPIITEAKKFFFSPKKTGGIFGFGAKKTVDNSPVLMIIFTDGNTFAEDRDDTYRMLKGTEHENIYWHFVGIGGNGPSSFPIIKYLADELSNVGDVYLSSIDIPEEELYEQIISNELVEWFAGLDGNRATA
jgi:hypothetical protein